MPSGTADSAGLKNSELSEEVVTMTYGEMLMYGVTAFTAAGSLVFALVMTAQEVWHDHGKAKKSAKVPARAM